MKIKLHAICIKERKKYREKEKKGKIKSKKEGDEWGAK